MFKVGNKDTEVLSINVFDGYFEHCFFNLFFWPSSFEVTLLYFALQNYFVYSVSLFNLDYVAELSVFLFLILLHIDKASEKKRNICSCNKFCVCFFYSYIFELTHLKLAFLINTVFWDYIYTVSISLYVSPPCSLLNTDHIFEKEVSLIVFRHKFYQNLSFSSLKLVSPAFHQIFIFFTKW